MFLFRRPLAAVLAALALEAGTVGGNWLWDLAQQRQALSAETALVRAASFSDSAPAAPPVPPGKSPPSRAPTLRITTGAGATPP
jgi:hypothetical protein